MDMSQLPEEIFIEIALYLDLEDLLSCSLVNSRWRHLINQNKIWFRLCAKRTILERNKFELIEDPCYVEPHFSFPTNICDSLSEICQWKKRFMQEAHLSRNWRHGRYFAEYITTQENTQFIECEENVLLINIMEKRKFIVYSICHNPQEIQTVSYSLWHVSSDLFKLCGNKLVVLQCTLLQVYDKMPDDKFQLTHRVLFNKSQADSLGIPLTPDISSWYKNNIGLYPSDLSTTCDHNGKYFIGLILEGNLNKAVFHIWNISTGEKFGEERVPVIENKILDIRFSLHKSNLHMLIKIRGSSKEHTTIYCYNLDYFKFTDLKLIFDYVVPVILFSDKFVINEDTTGKCLLLWRSDNGKFIKKINCVFEINPMTVKLVFSFIIFAGNSFCSSVVKVFDTDRMKVTCEFYANYKVTNLLFVRSDMILAGSWNHIGLWDITTATKLHTFEYVDWVWTNSTNSRVVVEYDEKLFLLNFW